MAKNRLTQRYMKSKNLGPDKVSKAKIAELRSKGKNATLADAVSAIMEHAIAIADQQYNYDPRRDKEMRYVEFALKLFKEEFAKQLASSNSDILDSVSSLSKDDVATIVNEQLKNTNVSLTDEQKKSLVDSISSDASQSFDVVKQLLAEQKTQLETIKSTAESKGESTSSIQTAIDALSDTKNVQTIVTAFQKNKVLSSMQKQIKQLASGQTQIQKGFTSNFLKVNSNINKAIDNMRGVDGKLSKWAKVKIAAGLISGKMKMDPVKTLMKTPMPLQVKAALIAVKGLQVITSSIFKVVKTAVVAPLKWVWNGVKGIAKSVLNVGKEVVKNAFFNFIRTPIGAYMLGYLVGWIWGKLKKFYDTLMSGIGKIADFIENNAGTAAAIGAGALATAAALKARKNAQKKNKLPNEEKINKEIEGKKKNLNERQSELEKLKEQNEKLKNERERLKEELEKVNKERELERNKNSERSKQLEEQKNRLEKEIEEKNRQIKDQEEKISEKQKEVEQAKEELKKSEEKLKEEVEKTRAEEQAKAKAEKEAAVKQAQEEAAKAEAERAAKMRQQYEQQVEQLNKEKGQIEEQLKAKEERLSRQQEAIEKMKSELKNNKELTDKRVKELEEKLKSTEKNMAKQAKEIEAKQKALDEANAKIKDAQTKATEAKQDVSKAKAEEVKAKQETAKAEAKSKAAEAKVAEAKAPITPKSTPKVPSKAGVVAKEFAKAGIPAAIIAAIGFYASKKAADAAKAGDAEAAKNWGMVNTALEVGMVTTVGVTAVNTGAEATKAGVKSMKLTKSVAKTGIAKTAGVAAKTAGAALGAGMAGYTAYQELTDVVEVYNPDTGKIEYVKKADVASFGEKMAMGANVAGAGLQGAGVVGQVGGIVVQGAADMAKDMYEAQRQQENAELASDHAFAERLKEAKDLYAKGEMIALGKGGKRQRVKDTRTAEQRKAAFWKDYKKQKELYSSSESEADQVTAAQQMSYLKALYGFNEKDIAGMSYEFGTPEEKAKIDAAKKKILEAAARRRAQKEREREEAMKSQPIYPDGMKPSPENQNNSDSKSWFTGILTGGVSQIINAISDGNKQIISTIVGTNQAKTPANVSAPTEA